MTIADTPMPATNYCLVNHMNRVVKSTAGGAASVFALIAFVLACLSSFLVAHADAPSGVLFEQPSLPGIDGNFHVPPAEHMQPPTGVFHMILWQPNPNRSDGMLVPTDWKAGEKTGFYPSAPVDKHQASYRNAPGSSTVQIDGDTVGAYINSVDLPEGSHLFKMMITPSITMEPSSAPHPFAQPGRAIFVSLELQVPTAVDAHNPGSETYVSADLNFIDPNRGTKISYGCNLFLNGHPHREPGGHIKLDQDTQNMMINSVVGLPSAWLTTVSGSAVSQSAPWTGWKTFRFAITEKNLIDALNALNQRDTTAKASLNAGDYAFVKFHLNAELHFKTSSAELGWSMRDAKIVIEDSALLKQSR